MKKILIKIIKKYQSIPFKSHDSCKFIPTCSNYMIDALKKHGPILGLIMGICRILRCNPFIRGGVDPVPDNFTIFRNPHPERYEDEIIASKFHPDSK